MEKALKERSPESVSIVLVCSVSLIFVRFRHNLSLCMASAAVVELLNLDNYEYWSRCVKSYLLAEGLWNVVADPPKPVNGKEFDDWTRLDAKALHVIQISSGSAFFPLITDATTAAEAWNMLEGKLRSDSYLPKKAATVPVETNGANVTLHQKEYLAFFKGEDVDWVRVILFLNDHPEAATIKHPESGQTCLHTAVLKGDVEVVGKILNFFEEKNLEEKDFEGKTAFFLAVWNGKFEIVKRLESKNKALVYTCTDHGHKNVFPVLLALWADHREMVEYLYPLTPKECLDPENTENGPNHNGADIITHSIQKKYFDIALDLVQLYPKLVITKDFSGYYPLILLAGMPSAFKSGTGTSLNFWQQWIYNYIDKDLQANQMDLIKSVRRFSIAVLKLVGLFDRIDEMRSVHVQVLQILKPISQLIRDNGLELHDSVVQKAIFRAVQYGHVEFVSALMEYPTFPDLQTITDNKCRSIFAFAIACRQEKVYNLIYDIQDESYILFIGKMVDIFQNSLLHIAGTLSPSIQIRDAALQMQRELQWFKEIESLVSPTLHEFVNFADNMTGRELFTKNHKDLVKEGEKSMKETATSCTVVGALIITIMFAVAFTVAGGNDGSTGLPVFLKEKLFTVFIVSDALSLFSSTTSVVMFLGILTSRYAENDFLTSLPTKMMIGLLTLFFSIATMMVAFSTTLIMMLRDKYSWIVFPIVLLACVPVIAFVLMQSPLLYDICVSTYGSGIFRKRRMQSRRHRLKEFCARMKGKVVRAFTPKLSSVQE